MAKKIEVDEALKEEFAAIAQGLSEDLRQKMLKGAEAAAEYIKSPDLSEEDVAQIQRMAALQRNC